MVDSATHCLPFGVSVGWQFGGAMTGDGLAADKVVGAGIVGWVGLDFRFGKVIGIVLNHCLTHKSPRIVVGIELTAEQVALCMADSISVADHVIPGNLVGGLDHVPVFIYGCYADRDYCICTESVGSIGGIPVFNEELHIAIGNRHGKCSANLAVRDSVIQRCCQIVCIVRRAEHETITVGRNCGVAAEGQENRTHRTRVTVFQSKSAIGLCRAVVLLACPC